MREIAYFVSFVSANDTANSIGFGNATVYSDKKGKELIEYIIAETVSQVPSAIVLGITKME